MIGLGLGLSAAVARTAPTPRVIFVAPGGSDSASGREGDPLASIQKAIDDAPPGSTIWLADGTYEPATRILIRHRTDLTISALPGARPLIDAINYATPNDFNDRAMQIEDCSRITMIGIGITNGPDGGLQILGTCSDLYFKGIESFGNGRASLFEGEGIKIEGIMHNVVFDDCDCHGNLDAAGEDVGGNADGFRWSIYAGSVTFNRCRAWRNSDDGFDGFNNSFGSGVSAIVPVYLNDCQSWENGYLANGEPSDGDGNGYKLGGQREGLGNSSGGIVATGIMAWGNREIGMTDNEATHPNILNRVIAYDNGRMNIEAGTEANPGPAHTITNSIALVASEANVSIQVLDNVQNNSWDLPVTATVDDFMSVDDTIARGPRGPDYALPESDFLRLIGAPEVYASDLIGVGIAGVNLGPDRAPGTYTWAPGATIAIDFRLGFASTGNAPEDEIAVVRDTPALAPDAAGVWWPFEPDEPRITDLGLLGEPEATNEITNSVCGGASNPSTWPDGWSIGSLNGLTATVHGAGVKDGIDYVEVELAGTTSGGGSTQIYFEGGTVIAAANGQDWTLSAFCEQVSGTWDGMFGEGPRLGMFENTSTESYVTEGGSDSFAGIGGEWARCAFHYTLEGGGTVAHIRPYISIVYPGGATIGVRFRIGLPQAERGTRATSPIRTSGTAQTRTADHILLVDPDVVSVPGTLYAEWQEQHGAMAQERVALGVRVDGENFMAMGIADSNKLSFRATTGGVSQVAIASSADVTAGVRRQAVAVDHDDVAMATNQEEGIVTDGSATLPDLAGAVVGIASDGAGGAQLNGFLRRIAVYPDTLAEEELEARVAA